MIDTSLFTGPATGKGWSSTIISPEGQVAAIQSLMTNAGRITPVHHEVGGDPRFADPAMAAGQAFAKQSGVTAAVARGKAPAADPAARSARQRRARRRRAPSWARCSRRRWCTWSTGCCSRATT